jgi:ribonuclease HI
MHILWQCQSSRDVWSLGNRAVQKSAICGGSFKEVLENLFQKCSQDDMEQVAGLARRIWLRRNEVVFGGLLSSPQFLLQRTDQAIADFKLAQGTRAMLIEGLTIPGSTHWTAPSQEWIKANWDAALSQQRNRMGLAAVVRDWMGKLVVASCTTQMGCPDPSTAEALSALRAIKICKALSMMKIHLEGDTKVVIDALLNGEEDRSQMGNAIEDIKEELRTVPHWKVSFVRKDGNKVAHVLSKTTLKCDLDQEWVEPPNYIRDLLLLEQLALV